MPFASHDEYLASVPADRRALLRSVQQEVNACVPGAVACIGYNMPAYRLQRILFYFAAFKHHIGVYPPLTEDQALIQATLRYRGPKGNLAFPIPEALPLQLIGDVAQALAAQYGMRPDKRRSPA